MFTEEYLKKMRKTKKTYFEVEGDWDLMHGNNIADAMYLYPRYHDTLSAGHGKIRVIDVVQRPVPIKVSKTAEVIICEDEIRRLYHEFENKENE